MHTIWEADSHRYQSSQNLPPFNRGEKIGCLYGILVIICIFAFKGYLLDQIAQAVVDDVVYEEAEQFSCLTVTEIPQIECEALVALYNGINGSNWHDTTGWLVTDTPCSWYGVICDGGHITQLELVGRPLSLIFDQDRQDDSLLPDINLLQPTHSASESKRLPPEDLIREIGKFNNLHEIIRSSFELNSLPPEIGSLRNLTDLTLSFNQLNSLPPEIGNLNNLTKLDISSNQLSNLPAKIGDLHNLTTLYLGGNQLHNLPSETSKLHNLTTLDLRENRISNLSAEIGNLNNLTTLFLGGNQLSTLPTKIGDLHNLTTLDLRDNQINDISAEIGNLNNLDTLFLGGNQLSTLPTKIGNLHNLTTLDLRDNQISDLPAEIGNLNNLTALFLGGNQLSSLPAQITDFNALVTLDLQNNQLSSLPSEIGNLQTLTTLFLGGNHLNSLSAEISNLKNLTALYLDSNQLSSLPTEISNLKNLIVLNLTYNQISALDDDLYSFVTEYDAQWLSSQTIAPTDVVITGLGPESIELTWTPIAFQDNGGHYEISLAEGGDFTVHGMTYSKSNKRYVIDGLTRGTTYKIRIRTYTPTHVSDGRRNAQKNELWSEYSPEALWFLP